MSPETPTEYGVVMSLDELQTRKLNCYIFEETHVDTESAKIFYVFLLYIPVILYVLDKKKKNSK